MTLTPEQAAFVTPYIKSQTSAQSMGAMSNTTRRQLQDDVLDILCAAARHGVDAMTVSQIADQYQQNTGRYKPPSSFSSAVDALRSAKRICEAGQLLYVGTGRMQVAYAVVAQQARLVG
jgi:hypothetical protein